MPQKLFVPDKILRKIELKCIEISPKDKFTFSDLSGLLGPFIKERLKGFDKELHETYRKVEGIESTNLRRAWSYEGKADDGATKELRDLICYFGFEKNWSDTLVELKIDESDVIKWTKQAKAKYTQQKGVGIEDAKSQRPEEITSFANRVYIELSTRKAAIPFDEEHDLIEQVYDSWYELFKTLRDEMKDVPVLKMQKAGIDLGAVDATQQILNNVLRPHLTEHQARFRAWMQHAKANARYKKLSPQDLQKEYPGYKTLVKSLKQVNKELGVYAEGLREMV